MPTGSGRAMRAPRWLTIMLVLAVVFAAAPAALAGTPSPAGGHDHGGGRDHGGGHAGVAATPPMGWNDYYAFICDLNEQLIEQTADTIASSGMKAAGYEYVNLDDCWLSHQRDAHGRLQADPVKFPHGIKAVADYVHRRGLKLGIYEDVGTQTCAQYPGSYGHVQQDADTFASWDIDYVKVDWCYVPFDQFPGLTQQQIAIKLYRQYGEALRRTGRPMVYSVCEWDPTLQPWTWAAAVGGNLWRTSNDYGDTWRQTLANSDAEAPLARYAGPHHWNDADILQVGLGGQTDAQYRAQFSLWSILASPLLAGSDLRTMSVATHTTLTNREVIAIDQDRLGRQGVRVFHTDTADVWTRQLANGDRAVLLLNRSTSTQAIATTARAVGLHRSHRYTVRDLWTHTTTSSRSGDLSATVPPTSAVMYRVSEGHGH